MDWGEVFGKAIDKFIFQPQDAKNQTAQAAATAAQLKAEADQRTATLEMAKLQAQQNARQIFLMVGLAAAALAALLIVRKGR